LMLKMAEELPRAVRTDESKLRQVVLNLVGNAVKFTSQGSVTVNLESRPLGEGPRVSLVIEVEDTGDGIATQDRQRIFQPFVQVGHASDQKGTGLGLSITRQFVELMGGMMGVESTPGKGSVFRVEVPVELADDSTAVFAETKETLVAHLAPGQPEYRVLIVEDQVENWQLLRRLLEQTGFQVRVAENGVEGVAAFQSWRPHFIWMDWRMPVMDGLEATRSIRGLEGGRDVKIATLSASVFKEDREQVLAAGADDFVTKPIQFNRIYDSMARLLGVRYLHDGPPAPNAPVPAAALDNEALAALPSLVRLELADALVSLDAGRIDKSIRRVAESDPSICAVLEDHASRFQYSIILRALRSCQDGVLEEKDAV
jgi:CheY-like chemotaxis protein